MLYPVKETVSQPWHKVSLLIQISLGGVEFPNDEESNNLRRQALVEKKVAFECMQRLVRCFIECVGANKDAVGTRIGLDLSRSIAANSWEGMPTQLLQVPGIGPVGMRKLVNQEVRTVLDLAEKSYMDIDRLLARNPPFGKKTKETLEKFPRLTLDAEIATSTVSQEGCDVCVKVILAHNEKGQGYWNSRPPRLTFMAETTSGVLVFFWRGSMMKLGGSSRHELEFPVRLTGLDDIICHFSCEEIVGTLVSTLVRQYGPRGATNDRKVLELSGDASDKVDTFSDIEWLLDVDSPEPSLPDIQDDPVQLPNGKWQCNHVCAGGTLTKAGKACTHRCCRDGLDRPRKRKASNAQGTKRRSEVEDEDAPLDASLSRRPSQPTQQSQAGDRGKRRKLNFTDATLLPHSTQKAVTLRKPLISVDDDSEIELIDLVDSDEESDPGKSAKYRPYQSHRKGPKSPLTPVGTGERASVSDGFDSDVFDDIELTSIEGLLSLSCQPEPVPISSGACEDFLNPTLDKDPPVRDSCGEAVSPRRVIHNASKLLDLPISPSLVHDDEDLGGILGSAVELDAPIYQDLADDCWGESIFDEANHTTGGEESATDSGIAAVTTVYGTEEDAGKSCGSPANGEEEPSWVQQFDPDFVDYFRGYVNFI